MNYRLERWSDPSHFFKRIVVENSEGRRLDEYLERVAKFEVPDFCRMFGAYSLHIDAVYGDYKLNPYDYSTSPRLILIARKSGSDILCNKNWRNYVH